MVSGKLKALLLAPLFLLSVGMAKLEAKWLVKEEFISPEKEQFDCHGSNIIETIDGQFVVVFKGGPGLGKSNIDIERNIGLWETWFNGSTWSAPEQVVDASDSVCWTPVLTKNSLGELLFFYRIGPDPRRLVSFFKKSVDQGAQWSEGEILPAGIVGPTKNKPVITPSGRLVSPSSFEAGDPDGFYKATACWIEISDDNGDHWQKVGPLEAPGRKFGVIEPALFFDAQGKLRMLCRDRSYCNGQTGYIWTAVSEDEGLHWSELKPTSLPNPDSSITVVDLGGGKVMLIYNHSHTDRFPINMAVSLDGGDTWSEPLVLDTAGEVPSAILSSDGLVHITYAFTNAGSGQRRIKHVVVDPAEVLKETMFN